MANTLVNTRPVQCTEKIPGGLTPGKFVKIRGHVSPDGQRFDINFQTGPSNQREDDIAFNISVRLLQGYIAMNTFQRQLGWGHEQGSGTLPINTGQKFEMIVSAERSHYKITINGKYFAEYRHRLPLNRVTHLSIDGDVSVTLTSWEEESVPPLSLREDPPPYSGLLPNESLQPLPWQSSSYPPVPYIKTIEDGFEMRKMVKIEGYVSPFGRRFHINLQTGPSLEHSDDIALHISVRLLQGYIARNSFKHGSWGYEENSGILPIGTGEKFEIIILAEPSHYKIAINGKHYTEYKHRIPLHRVSHLFIEGDISLTFISWEKSNANFPTASTHYSGCYEKFVAP